MFDEMFDQCRAPIDVQYCWEKPTSKTKPISIKSPQDASRTMFYSGSQEAINKPTFVITTNLRDADQTLQNDAKMEPM